jgi:hypothetical protein
MKHTTHEGELEHYFDHEAYAPAVAVGEVTGGGSPTQREPRFKPGADTHLMALVYKRLQVADKLMPADDLRPCASTILRCTFGALASQRPPGGGHQTRDTVDPSWVADALEVYADAAREVRAPRRPDELARLELEIRSREEGAEWLRTRD